MSLRDIFELSISGPWTTYDKDTQAKVSDTPYGRMLSFQGTDVNFTGGRIDGSIEDLKADFINAVPDALHGFRPLGVSLLLPVIAEIVKDVGPVKWITGWSLGGMNAKEAAEIAKAKYITFGSPRTRTLWHPRDVRSIDVILRTDGLARGFYLGYKRAAYPLYIGNPGFLDVREHSIAKYMDALGELGI